MPAKGVYVKSVVHQFVSCLSNAVFTYTSWLVCALGYTIAGCRPVVVDHQCSMVSLLPFAGKLAHCQGPIAAYPCPYVRLSFANASTAQIEEGMQRLGNVLRNHRDVYRAL